MRTHTAKTFVLLAVVLAAAVCAGNIPAQAQTFTTIYTFAGKGANGEYPSGGLAFDSNGALYGTTSGGGSGNNGIVFQLVPPTKQGGAWTQNVIYTFLGGADGQSPSGLVFDLNGNLYGTTYYGGSGLYTECGSTGCGTVYELSPPAQPGGAWTHTVLYSFQGSYDGSGPGEVVFGPNGLLYGTTYKGGSAGFYFSCVGYPNRNDIACGTVFELTPSNKKGGSWTKTILYSFPSYAGDGEHPESNVTFDSSGNLYGTTSAGGTSSDGIAYQLALPAKGKQTVLHDFTGGSDGGYPGGGLALGANGQLFGVAEYSGASGLVFQLALSNGTWTETVLYNFPGFSGDGTAPVSTPTLDPNGNLYGVTASGGTAGGGIVFKLAPPSGSGGWTETVLYNWPAQQGPMVVFHNGLLYGTASTGGSGLGSVFTLTP